MTGLDIPGCISLDIRAMHSPASCAGCLPRVERSSQRQLRTLRPDNDGEFVNAAFSEYLAMRGIRHETTVPYSSQQNGVAERANRTIVERTLIARAHLRLALLLSLLVACWDICS